MPRFLFFIACLILNPLFSQSNCDCDRTKSDFSDRYIQSKQLILRGKTLAVTKGVDYDRVTVSISHLFKGVATRQQDIYFESKSDCSLSFQAGEDWLIYADYKQGKALVQYCSRSRKNVINTNKNVDLMYIKSELSVDEECDKLNALCGLQPFSNPVSEGADAHSNIIPNGMQRIVLMLFSLLGFVVIYLMLNKSFKK